MTKQAGIAFLFFTLITLNLSANQKSICGPDDRISSTDTKIAKSVSTLDRTGGCTITMISKKCAISAGHCKSTFNYVQFNVPETNGTGISSPADTYRIDKKTIEYNNNGTGKDWAVMEILPHEQTGLYAGVVNGYYEVAFEAAKRGDDVRITGYGLDRDTPEFSFTQQTHEDVVVSVRGSTLKHTIDTMGGNSGSSVVRVSDNKIVAVHTHGGCANGGNSSTHIVKNTKFEKAIKACLVRDMQ